MYHFVRYLYHFIFILLWYSMQIIFYWFSDFEMDWKMVRRNLFFWILVPLRREGGEGGSCVCGCGQSSLYACISCFTIIKSRKKTFFFPCNINLRRAMLPNYLGTYYSALCQIWALEEAIEERNKCQSYPKKLGFWMHAFDWPEETVNF